MDRNNKINLLAAVVMGHESKEALKPKPVFNVNIGSLKNGTSRFTLNGKAISMAQAFEVVYSDNADYHVTKI